MRQISNTTVVRLLWAVIAVCVIALAGIAVAIPAKASDTFSLFSSDAQTGATQAAIRDVLSPSIASDDGARLTLDARVADFYQARDFKPVWTSDEDAQSNADLVRDTLGKADGQGLQASDYVKALSLWSDAPEPGEDAAAFDIALTRALFRYARDVRLGRVNPADVYKDVSLPPQDFDAGAAFAKALQHGTVGDFLADLPPHHPGYRGLVKALAVYRDIADHGGWRKVPTGISLERNDPRQAVLAARLSFEDPALASSAHPTSADLRIAVLRFQRRMGLVDNGKIDADTLAALNVSAGYRVKQIVANMERWRWVPRGFERDYIYVNVPDESLDFVHSRTSLLHSRVIVGMKTSPTPIMRTIVQAAVVNPPWDIPDDIAAHKLLPHLKQDASYLASRDMVLADGPSDDPHGAKIDWRHVNANNIPYQIQQNPGADNALGTLMLDSPNDFGVYMHDTPHKELFRAASRDKSNGCVRVQEIFALVSLALKEDPDDNDDLQQLIDAGKTQRLPLPAPLPVYMLYWTAIADADGVTQFRPDRYDRDPPLIARLTARSQPETRKKTPVSLSGAI